MARTIRSPWVAFGVVFGVCILFLCWHAYKRDPEDTSWTDSDVPPPMATVETASSVDNGPPGSGDPMRYRRYPTSLVKASASIIGTF